MVKRDLLHADESLEFIELLCRHWVGVLRSGIVTALDILYYVLAQLEFSEDKHKTAK